MFITNVLSSAHKKFLKTQLEMILSIYEIKCAMEATLRVASLPTLRTTLCGLYDTF